MRLRSAIVSVTLIAAAAHAGGAQDRPMRRVLLRVNSRNDDWTKTSLEVKPADLILVRALGLVRVGTFIGNVDASGVKPGNTSPSGSALLEYRIGLADPKPAGAQGLHVAESEGELQFRLRDTRYDDNAGWFTVDVVVIPDAVLPVPMSPAEMAELNQAPLRTMREYLRMLAVAEEAFFSDSAHYGAQLGGRTPRASPSLTIESLSAAPDGKSWVAIVTNRDVPGVRCAIAVGTKNPIDASADEGVPICR